MEPPTVRSVDVDIANNGIECAVEDDDLVIDKRHERTVNELGGIVTGEAPTATPSQQHDRTTPPEGSR